MTPNTETRRGNLTGDSGFTLLEVMVVVLVIGILLVHVTGDLAGAGLAYGLVIDLVGTDSD